MSTHTKTLEELIKELPPDSRDEVRNFIELLIAHQRPNVQTDQATSQNTFEQLFGAWDSGDENSADNERIDADLARAYADNHRASS